MASKMLKFNFGRDPLEVRSCFSPEGLTIIKPQVLQNGNPPANLADTYFTNFV